MIKIILTILVKMKRYFELKELFAQVRKSRMFSTRFEHVQTYKVNNLKELCGKLPSDGEGYFIETRKSFTAFTFIAYLVKNAGYVKHIYVATYSTNDRIINALLRYKEKGLIGTIHLHISETIKFRMPQVFKRLKELDSDGVITLTYAWTHKKITCLETEVGHFVVEGSGNYGENALEEQYLFIKSKQVYEFRIGN